MKKIFIFLLFSALLSCNNINKNIQTSLDFNCPRVFFSGQDRIYVDNSTSIDDASIKAKLNNSVVSKKCQQKDELAIIPLDVLIIAQPMNILEEPEINIPIYISLLDRNDNVLETQYFMFSGFINKNPETNKYIETDISDRLTIITKNLETSQVVLGFMIDDKKRNLIN